MKNNKGITLIALVITIIVMLILVTVTIRVATDGKLFTHAANAVKGTQTAIEEENAILNDELDKSIEAIVDEQTGIIHFTIGETEYSAEEGMTLKAWVVSKYNKDGYKVVGDRVKTSDETKSVCIIPPRGGALPAYVNQGITSNSHFVLD